MMTEQQIKYMVDRFLRWNLPEDFSPDCGISFTRFSGEEGTPYRHESKPFGTNLFTAAQAEAMVRHLLEGLPGNNALPALMGAMTVLEAAYLELKRHDADYHHRTDPTVANMIVDALAEKPAEEAVEITVSPSVYNEVRKALVERGIGGVILERPLPRRIEMTGVTIVESVYGVNAPDWPPRVSAIDLPDGHRAFGSTGQLFEAQAGRWVRIKTVP